MCLRSIVLALALVGVCCVWAACKTEEEKRNTRAAPVEETSWTYVGDEACAQCHGDLYTDYHRTGMGRSVTAFDPETAPEQFGADGRSPEVCEDKSGYCYEAFVRGDTLFQREFRRDGSGYERVYPASHVVGSGNATRSYFMMAGSAETLPDSGGYLTEMPLTWYVERELWDLSPGYDQENNRFERPITLECLACHDANPGHETAQNYFTEVPLGISCERCHGPGSAHVETFLTEAEPAESRIVNPASLSPERRLDVCQQCHLTGTTVFAAGEDPTTYRPGRPLSAHRSVFVRQAALEDPEAFGIASHAERMTKSACFTETAGTEMPLTCTTCHNPHQPVDEAPAEHFREACLSCHAQGPPHGDGETDAAASSAHADVCSRPGPDSVDEAMTGNCVSCHMRTAGTSDIPHVSFTDHWIRVNPPADDRGRRIDEDRFRRTSPFRLVNMTAERTASGSPAARAAADLELGMALVMLYETEHRLPAYLPDAAARIRRGLAAGIERTDARVALGRALLEMDSLQSARSTLDAAFASAPENAFAAYWAGTARFRTGRLTGALEALRQSVRVAPHFTEARLKLAEVQARAGQVQAAVATLEEALRRDPERHAGAWNDLGLYRFQLQRLGSAAEALNRALHLDPRLATARVNLATVHLQQGNLDAAATQLTRALEQEPQNVAALGNLGVVRMRQGRAAAARRAFERLLQITPGDARARAYLNQLSDS